MGNKNSENYAEATAEVNGDTLVVYNIYVDESLRRSGVGSKLINSLKKYTGTTKVQPEMVMPGSEDFWNRIVEG